jgi:hypothetical protein
VSSLKIQTIKLYVLAIEAGIRAVLTNSGKAKAKQEIVIKEMQFVANLA